MTDHSLPIKPPALNRHMEDHTQAARPPALNNHQTDHSRPERAAPVAPRATQAPVTSRARPVKPPATTELPVIFPLPNVPVARLDNNNPGDHNRPVKPPKLEGQNKG
jgi:hypothetical protein